MMRKYAIKIRIIIMFSLMLLCMSARIMAEESFEVHILDVGQGQAVLVQADGEYMLIDGGGRNTSSFVVSYLKQTGVDRLGLMAASHYDDDHISGLIGALSVFDCGTLLLPSYIIDTDLFQSFALAALSNGCDIIHPKAEARYTLGDAEIEVVGPIREDYSNENDRSLCLHITYGDMRILVCGDAQQESELDMVSAGANLSADLYIVNHHGSNTSTMDAFLNAVNPDYAVICCGKDNGYGHPSMETMQRLKNYGVSIFRTDEQGTVIAYSNGNDIWFNIDPSENWSAGSGTVIPLETNNDLGGTTDGTSITRIMAGEMEQDDPGQQEAQTESFQYVCNINTKKFHYPGCNSVNQMKEENRLYTSLSREELIAEGYEPCGNCKP